MNLMNIDKRFDTILGPSEVHPRTDHLKCGPDVRNCTIHDDVVRKPLARCRGSRRTEGKAAGKLPEVRAPKLKRMLRRTFAGPASPTLRARFHREKLHLRSLQL